MASHSLRYWEPEDQEFWSSRGRYIARRNLWVSTASLMLSFAVWMIWSVLVVHLPDAGFRFTTNQLFWLAALPGLSGATLRLVFAFLVPIVGGRTWMTLSTALLLVPAVGVGLAVQDPGTSFPTMVVLALACGLGGGNFASSISHVSFFYPRDRMGTALGVSAGVGNLGVLAVQLVVPVAIGASFFGALGGAPQSWTHGGEKGVVWLQNAGFVWVPFILLATAAAWYGSDNIESVRASLEEQAVIFRRLHNWLLSWLYLGTFGSFIGFSAALPLLLQSQFPARDALAWAWLGPLLGVVARPLGGWLSDRFGGARIALAAFIGMALGVLALLGTLSGGEIRFAGFLGASLVLFLLAGAGNGATFKMIPAVFRAEHLRGLAQAPSPARERALRQAGVESAASLGFASAIGAYGAFFIPKFFGTSAVLTGGPQGALLLFVAFYATCIAVTWWFYARPGASAAC
jgi:NNP family nitrate/nitrite transporter-like MFS transporter